MNQDFDLAGSAPGGPEVEQHHFAFEARQSDFRTVGIEESEVRGGLAIVILHEDDLGDGDGVVFHVAGELHGVAGIRCQRRQVLIGDLEDLAVTDKDEPGAVADARQGTTPVIQAGVHLRHFLVADRANAVADLAFPGHGGGGGQAGEARQQAQRGHGSQNWFHGFDLTLHRAQRPRTSRPMACLVHRGRRSRE